MTGLTGATGSTAPTGVTGPSSLLLLVSTRYGGECAIQDPGCYVCLDAFNPDAGCAKCASGFKLATQPLKGRRAALASSSPAVPYCVGSVLTSAAENELVNAVGQLQPKVNAVSAAKLDAFRNIVKGFNSTVGNAMRSLGNGPNAALAGAAAPIQDLLRDPMQAAEEQRSAISSLVMELAAEERV